MNCSVITEVIYFQQRSLMVGLRVKKIVVSNFRNFFIHYSRKLLTILIVSAKALQEEIARYD
jgi:hypothetical protein